jgi:hypothetical protein
LYLSDLDESEIVFDVDVVLITCILDEVVSLGEVFAERFVGVDYGEFRCFPTQFASFCVEVPLGLRDKEVVILNLSMEAVWWDVEVGISSIEVEVNSIALGNCGFP